MISRFLVCVIKKNDKLKFIGVLVNKPKWIVFTDFFLLHCCQVMNNLHVVFTMNPSTEGLKDRAATSPALFNRYNTACSDKNFVLIP